MAYSYFLGCSYSHGFRNMNSFQGIPRTALCAWGFNGTDSDLLGRTEGVKVHVVARVQSAPTSKERYIKIMAADAVSKGILCLCLSCCPF